MGKVRVLVLLFKSGLLQSLSSSILAHTMERSKDTECTGQTSKTKPNTYQEVFCKAGIDPEGLKRVTPQKSSK